MVIILSYIILIKIDCLERVVSCSLGGRGQGDGGKGGGQLDVGTDRDAGN